MSVLPSTEDPRTSVSPASPPAVDYAIVGADCYPQIVDRLARTLDGRGVDGFHLTRLCAGTDELEILATWDARGEPGTAVNVRYSRTEYPGASLVTAASAFVSDDCAADARLDEGARQRLAEDGIRSIGHYPLLRRGEFAGTLTLVYRARHVHTPEEQQFFGLVAALVSAALTNIEGHAQLQRQMKRWKAMHRAAETIGSVSDEDALLSAAAQLLIDEIGMVDSFIGVIDEDASVLRERASAGLSAYPGRPPLSWPLTRRDVNIVDVTFTGEPVVVRDAQQRADAEGWGHLARAASLRNVMIAPIRTGDKVFGAMGTGQALVDITQEDLIMFTTFASHLATAIARARSNRERQKQLAALEAANEQQARLLDTVRELSTPVMPVHEGILVLPLVGTIDTSRSTQLMETLLHAIQKASASVVIIDVTGVAIIDTRVAEHLLQSARAAALLGASCILVGISPVVAQTLVDLGMDLGGITTRNDLQAGIAHSLALMNLQITPRAPMTRAR